MYNHRATKAGPHPSRRSIWEAFTDRARSTRTPAVILDPGAVARNHHRLIAAFPEATIYYAMKANPSSAVLGQLSALGCGLDIASGAELTAARNHRFPAESLCFSAPFKTAADIAKAHAAGVDLYVADSPGEIEKLAVHAPGAAVLIRVAVTGGTSANPMGTKFGANLDEVVPLLLRARLLGLRPYGFHFHAGSQCVERDAWARAIQTCAPLWHEAKTWGLPMTVLDIGGGFPIRYDAPVPSIEAIATSVHTAMGRYIGDDVQLAIEPGRWLTMNAAALVTEVIGLATRGAEEWAYLDVGVYNGLFDARDGLRYPIRTLAETVGLRTRIRRPVTLAGPTCDGSDVIVRDFSLPRLAMGDRLVVFQVGGYTTAIERFNGIDFPSIVPLPSHDGVTIRNHPAEVALAGRPIGWATGLAAPSPHWTGSS